MSHYDNKFYDCLSLVTIVFVTTSVYLVKLSLTVIWMFLLLKISFSLYVFVLVDSLLFVTMVIDWKSMKTLIIYVSVVCKQNKVTS